MDLNTVNEAISLGRNALTLTKTALRKLNTAENLSGAEGLIGDIIASMTRKSANKAADTAEEAVEKFNACIEKIGGYESIYMSADAPEGYDSILFTSVESSLLASYTAIRRRTEDAVKAIEKALDRLERAKSELENA